MKKLIALVALLVSVSANAANPVVMTDRPINEVKMILAKHYSALPNRTLTINGDNLIVTQTGLFASTIGVTTIISDGKETMVTFAAFSKLDDITANVLSRGMNNSKDAINISEADQKRIEAGLNKLLNNKE
jgi:hypothetical protein